VFFDPGAFPRFSVQNNGVILSCATDFPDDCFNFLDGRRQTPAERSRSYYRMGSQRNPEPVYHRCRRAAPHAVKGAVGNLNEKGNPAGPTHIVLSLGGNPYDTIKRVASVVPSVLC